MKTVENRIKTLLLKIGVDPSLLGYNYLVEAIKICYADNNVLYRGMTKILYPEVAKIFDTTPSRVERAMRHSIEKVCDNNPNGFEILVFLPPAILGKYANSQFIGACIEYLKMNEEE